MKFTIFTTSSRTVFVLEGTGHAASTSRCMQQCVHFIRGAAFWILVKMSLENATQIVGYSHLRYKGKT
jgi:hypothetical protein